MARGACVPAPSRMPSPATAEGVPSRGARVLPAVALLLLLALAAPLLMQNALDRPVSRDEHQFVASAALLARQGLLPFRDYPYFHVPYQVPAQALFIKLGADPLTGARLCSLAFGLGCLGLVFWGAWRYLGGLPRWLGLGLAAALMVWLTHSPLFLYTSGRAWNHDLALFLALASFLVLGQALGRPRPARLLWASGFLLGLAAGVRLSWAPAVLPMLVAIHWLGPPLGRPRSWRLGLPFLGGLCLAGLPLLVLALAAWDDLLFGVLVYPGQLTTQFWAQQGYAKAMTWASKLDFFHRHVLPAPGDLALFGTFAQTRLLMAATLLLALPLNLLALAKRAGAWRQSGLMLLLLPVVFLGAMLPTPNMFQYYYQAVPLCLLALALALGALPQLASAGPRGPWLWAPLGLLVAYVLAHGGYHLAHAGYKAWKPEANPERVAAAALGREMARQVGAGRVLTLTPIFPLEGGLEVYPELASGPFALRVAHLLPPEQRRARRMVAPADLEEFLAPQPPAAILSGLEKELDPHLMAYAQAHGYQPRPLAGDRLVLWLPDQRVPPAGQERP